MGILDSKKTRKSLVSRQISSREFGVHYETEKQRVLRREAGGVGTGQQVAQLRS